MRTKIYSFLKFVLLIVFFYPSLSWSDKNINNLPELDLMGIDGNKHQLKEWQDKVIVLNFWATYCIPCKKEIKDLIRYQQTYADKGLQIVGVGVNGDQSIKTMSLLLGINYPVLLGDIEKTGNEDILKDWGNNKSIIPYTIAINSQGVISYRHNGILRANQFEQNILPLLSESKKP